MTELGNVNNLPAATYEKAKAALIQDANWWNAYISKPPAETPVADLTETEYQAARAAFLKV